MNDKQSSFASGTRGSVIVGHGSSRRSKFQGLSLKYDPTFRGVDLSKSDHMPPNLAKSASSENDEDRWVDDPDFNYPGADLHLRIGNRHFWVHKDMLRDFKGLRPQLDKAPKDVETHYKLLVLEDTVQDVRNMLLMLYTKPYESQNFNTKTLESCLKLATKYNNPWLRSYAIKHLGQQPLQSVDRFRLGRDYDVGVWRMMATGTLSLRDEPLTVAEALVLGFADFTSIAANREKLQYEKGQRGGVFGPSTPAPRAEDIIMAKGPLPTSDPGQKKHQAKLPGIFRP